MANATSEALDTANLSFSMPCAFLEFIEPRECSGGKRWSENGSRKKRALWYDPPKTLVFTHIAACRCA